MSRLRDNLSAVRQRIAEAALASGRSADQVRLVAVTKYAGDDVIHDLVAAGCFDLGEARPQALWAKAAALAEALSADLALSQQIRWHLIGHLQRNKIERTLPLVSLIHSADSLRLLRAIEQTGAQHDRRVPVLLEVNVSGDSTKHGFAPSEVAAVLPEVAAMEHVSLRGLMCMAAREGDEAVARRNFASLRELRDGLRPDLPDRARLDELSMGMSGDFEIAIEEGATVVRIGSALFEGVVH
jgi:pyridoxal phosphate enzyme (YggS family)